MIYIYRNNKYNDCAICIALNRKNAVEKFKKLYLDVNDWNVWKATSLFKRGIQAITY